MVGPINAVFRPRNSSKDGAMDSKRSQGPLASFSPSKSDSSSAVELTKNTQYCVSRLPALPTVLENPDKSEVLNGYSDHVSNYSVVVTETRIFVWYYPSVDASPLTVEFPVDSTQLASETPVLPLVMLTRPAHGTTEDPGIVIIDGTTGLVKFYESVQHSPALGLIGNKNLEIAIPVDYKRGEFVVFAENVEPAGIVVVTSWKRCVLVSLRDHKFKPLLSIHELIKPQNPMGIISGMFSGSKYGRNYINDDIVCIRSGGLYNHGSTQEVFVQENSGILHRFVIQLTSGNGVPVIDTANSFTQNLNPYVVNSIDGVVPYSNINIMYLDIWKLQSSPVSNTFLSLCLVVDEFDSTRGDSLYLVTEKIDSSGVLVYGSHKLNRFDGSMDLSNVSKPRLFVPLPEDTAFITYGNSIILSDIDTSYILDKGTVLYYKPRWEDVITIKQDVEIIGCGYENQSLAANNPAVVLLTSNFGVLRVERFPQTSHLNNNKAVKTDLLNPVNLVKSHIEQAIYYSMSEPINFDLNEKFTEDIVTKAIRQIVLEIMISVSPYLPSFFSSITSLLDKKCQLFHNIISYCERNFPSLANDASILVLDGLQKTKFALNFWICIDSNEKIQTKTKGLLLKLITEEIPSINREKDILRKYFSEQIDTINTLVTAFISRAIESDIPDTFVFDVITKSLYDGVLIDELKYYQGKNFPPRKSWIFDTQLLVLVERFFESTFNQETGFTPLSSTRGGIVKLCHVLYYFITGAITYMQRNDTDADVLKNYIAWYNKSKVKWIIILLSNGASQDAMELVEAYSDFTSLAHILEEERERIIQQYSNESLEYSNIMTKYHGYLETYQYEFAKDLFNYYIKHDKIQMLLSGFEKYNYLLEEYFSKNSDKVSSIAWIKKLMDGDFKVASDYLLNSARLNENESQKSKELKYSLAKLSAVAANKSNINDNDQSSNMDVDDTLYDIETQLILIRIQESLFNSLEGIPKGESQDQRRFDIFLNNYVNEKVDKNGARMLFEPSFSDFINNKPINQDNLIKYLTFIKPSIRFPNGFSNAFRVASLIPNEQEYQKQIRSIWIRLLVITDDWESFNELAANASDKRIESKIQDTLLYKTVSSFTNDKEINLLQQMVDDNDTIEDGDIVMSVLDNEYHERAQKIVKDDNLLEWIKSIRAENMMKHKK